MLGWLVTLRSCSTSLGSRAGSSCYGMLRGRALRCARLLFGTRYYRPIDVLSDALPRELLPKVGEHSTPTRGITRKVQPRN